jgi:hypothetical protein
MTVYVVETVGLATTTEPVVVFKPVGGDHEYVTPPLAVSVTEPPWQIAVLVEESARIILELVLT